MSLTSTLIYSTPNASLKTAHKYYPEKDTKNSSKSNGGSKNCAKLGTGSRRSPRLNNGVEGFSCRRRSPRLCNCGNTDEKTGNDKSVEVRNAKGSVDSCEQFVGKRERRLRSNSVGSATVIAERGERQARDVNKGDKDIVVKRKRKQGEEGVGHVQGNDKSVEVRNAKGSVDSCEQFVGKRERRLRSNSVGSATCYS
ncbi:hypothetical protein L1049_024404 [Liquidambar formosana]|uniref:Uncharacterized protein n=1 Tax=Liquidambar formosana TaxID=63359 RepID=A0AAP0RUV8_LIQFO